MSMKRWISVLGLLILCICLYSDADWHQQKAGLLIVPGLGRSDRLSIVVQNLQFIRKERSMEGSSIAWDCVVYVYAPRELVSFWSMADELRYLYEECKVVEVPNQKVTENLYMVQPALIEKHYKTVFIMLDDCKITDINSFSTIRMLKIMEANKLTVASPLVR